jgi:hypothetical protein
VVTYFVSPPIARYILYFLPSLNFLALSFKREGAKEASFLEVKLFRRRHFSKWVSKKQYVPSLIISVS